MIENHRIHDYPLDIYTHTQYIQRLPFFSRSIHIERERKWMLCALRENTCEKLIYRWIRILEWSFVCFCCVCIVYGSVSENLMRAWGLIDVFFDMLTQVNEWNERNAAIWERFFFISMRIEYLIILYAVNVSVCLYGAQRTLTINFFFPLYIYFGWNDWKLYNELK